MLAVPAIAEDQPASNSDEPNTLLKSLKERSANQRLDSLKSLFGKPIPEPEDEKPADNRKFESPIVLPDGSTVPQSPPFPKSFEEIAAPVPLSETTLILQPKPETIKPKNTKGEKLRPLSEILPFDDYQPADVAKVDKVPDTFWKAEKYEPRKFENALYAWEAADLYHYPLYFEDPSLERYGHTYHEALQPFASAARFGVQLIGIPYQATIDPVRKPVYTLGWYRPGECAPKLFYQIPWNSRAAAVQAGVTTGMFYLIP